MDLVVVGYACEVTEEIVPLTRSMATRLGMVCKNGAPWWLRPEQGPHMAGGVHVGKIFLTLVRTVKISCSVCAGDEAEDGEPRTRSMVTWFLRHTQVVGLLC